MILGFSTKFPKGKGILSNTETHFPERVIRSLTIPEYKKMILFDLFYKTKHEDEWLSLSRFQNLSPKKHTIRIDKNNRWNIDREIDFFIGVRTKNMFRFAPKTKVVSIQSIEIFKVAYVDTPYTVKVNGKCYQVSIDGKCLLKSDIKALAVNDGFDTVLEFFEWFNEDFSGKIIHWTNLKY